MGEGERRAERKESGGAERYSLRDWLALSFCSPAISSFPDGNLLILLTHSSVLKVRKVRNGEDLNTEIEIAGRQSAQGGYGGGTSASITVARASQPRDCCDGMAVTERARRNWEGSRLNTPQSESP